MIQLFILVGLLLAIIPYAVWLMRISQKDPDAQKAVWSHYCLIFINAFIAIGGVFYLFIWQLDSQRPFLLLLELVTLINVLFNCFMLDRFLLINRGKPVSAAIRAEKRIFQKFIHGSIIYFMMIFFYHSYMFYGSYLKCFLLGCSK